MLASAVLSALVLGASVGVEAQLHENEERVDPMLPWIAVDDEGQPSTTYSPTVTTIDGTPTPVNGAPHDLTASVYTWTTWGHITTSTGEPPNPTATKAGSLEGAFSRCYNLDGPFAPFCRPDINSTLLTGNTYYITWDPDYYNRTGLAGKTNATTVEISVRLDYLNTSSNEMLKLDTSDRVPARWGFWPFKLENDHLKGKRVNNVTITLLSSIMGSVEKNKSVALPVSLTAPGLDHTTPTKVPSGGALVIALPIVLGAIALIVIGLFLWHRKTRRIQLGNIMSRSRHGYNGHKHRSLFRRHGKDEGIPLDSSPPPVDYHDLPEQPRRDSDALGSLASSPDRAIFDQDQERNAFREEVARQDRMRRHE
ncbi:hypothetical protein RJ55_08433 [Drechmeria coniospora]|nr:hypothetical protein RJ55_08433 [Drechmeria coniospora]